MATRYRREDLVRPDGLLTALRDLFPDFGDEDLAQDVRAGGASLHTVMMEFSSTFQAASAQPSQLAGLAALIGQCVSIPDELESAVGTCLLEHLRQIDKSRALWTRLSPEVRTHISRQ
jgi:hypothetical protein